MNIQEREIVQALVNKADTFVNRTDPSPGVCTEDPCPWCTAGVELQLAILDAQDLLAGHHG